MTQLPAATAAAAGVGAAGARNPWLPAPIPSASTIRLLCFPHAGGGTVTFRLWPQDLPEWIGVVPVRLPGRETRTWEAPFTRVEPLVEALTAALTEDPALLHDQPYALFGHSLGALVAFETARALRRLAIPPPVHLLVSARIAPHLADPRGRLHDLPTDQFMDQLRALGGMPSAAFEHQAILGWLLPLVRADMTVNETYRWAAERSLSMPITAFGGTEDKKVSRHELAAWSAHTSAAFAAHLFPGGHFFAARRHRPLLDRITGSLAPWAP